MPRVRALYLVLLLGCSAEPASSIAPWDPVDPAFAGCSESCGSHADAPVAGAVLQPGAHAGDTTYCPVSGAVFVVDASRPHRDVGGQRWWFCCDGCARYFEAHRREVTQARQR